jgi:hypothetical protein
MDRTPVKSSNVKSLGYDAESKTVEVEFASGGVYTYHNVEPKTYVELMGAESIGKAVNQLKKGHEAKKVEEKEAEAEA